MAYARIAWVTQVSAAVCGAACAAAYRAYAIRPYKRRKTKVAKTTFDAGKTISYAGKKWRIIAYAIRHTNTRTTINQQTAPL